MTEGPLMDFPHLPNGMVSGRLKPEERDRLAALLQAKGGPKICEVCGSNEWALGDHIVTPQALARYPTSVAPAPGDPVTPSVNLFCSNCGNTKLINLLILGMRDILPGDDVP